MSTQSIDTPPPVTPPKADTQPKGSSAPKQLNATTAMIALIMMEMTYMSHMKKALPELKKNYEAMNTFEMMENWSGNYTRGQLIAGLANKSGGATIENWPYIQPYVGIPTITKGVPVDPSQIGSYGVSVAFFPSSGSSPHVVIEEVKGVPTGSIGIYLPTDMHATPFQQWALGMMEQTAGQTDYHQSGIYTGEDDAIATRAADGMQSKFDEAKMIASNIHEIFEGIAQLSNGKANAADSQ